MLTSLTITFSKLIHCPMASHYYTLKNTNKATGSMYIFVANSASVKKKHKG